MTSHPGNDSGEDRVDDHAKREGNTTVKGAGELSDETVEDGR